MSHTQGWHGILIVLLALAMPLFAACRGGEEPPAHRGMRAQIDTTRLQELYAGMERDHNQMMARYTEMRAEMPTDLQQMYQHMKQMRARSNAMHQQMMGGQMMQDQDMGMRGRGMMGQGAMSGVREWDQQMQAMHQGLAQMHERAGRTEMARMHQQMSTRYGEALKITPNEGAPGEGPAAPEGATLNGADLFAQQCASCHGSAGSGTGGAFPPLAGSEWVTGGEERLIRIVLHGLEGPVEVRGTRYTGVMPAFGSRLSDEEIGALLTHLRSSWGHDASEVTAEEVQEVREEYSGRTGPWSPSDVQ